MSSKQKNASLPPIVSAAEWQAAHETVLAKEKLATRARDALAAERRRMPRDLGGFAGRLATEATACRVASP